MTKPRRGLRSPSTAGSVQQALALHRDGKLSEAERFYKAVLSVNPGDFDALHLCGVLHHQQGRSLEALQLIGRALRSNSSSAEALSNLGVILDALERHEEALASFDAAAATP
jgi:Flp pilus assembly protein TadD